MADDVIDLILADHEKFKGWCDTLESEDEDLDKAKVYRELADLLIPHSEAEESVVYPAIEEAAPKQEEEVKDGAAEHHHIEEAMQRLLDDGPDAPGSDGVEAALVAELRHHMEEEEDDVLPDYKDKTTVAQRREIGEKFVEAKEKARSI